MYGPVPPDPFAVSIMVCPIQIPGFTPASTVGLGLTVTVIDFIPVQPPVSETVTVYIVVFIGFTVMDELVAPLLQLYCDVPGAGGTR